MLFQPLSPLTVFELLLSLGPILPLTLNCAVLMLVPLIADTVADTASRQLLVRPLPLQCTTTFNE